MHISCKLPRPSSVSKRRNYHMNFTFPIGTPQQFVSHFSGNSSETGNHGYCTDISIEIQCVQYAQPSGNPILINIILLERSIGCKCLPSFSFSIYVSFLLYVCLFYVCVWGGGGVLIKNAFCLPILA